MDTFDLPEWCEPFFQHHKYKCAYGGRSSSKTWTFAALLILDSMQKTLNCMCCRAIQNSINVSAKPALEGAIRRLKVGKYFRVQEHHIRCLLTGSRFYFQGLENRREAIRGWENIHRTWIEEAQHITHETAKILIPQVFRADGAELWVTWNPDDRTNWSWERFIEKPRATDLTRLVNYTDNPFLPEAVKEEIEECQREDPDLFVHVWLGEPDDGSGDTKVLPYKMIRKCVEAYEQGLAPVYDKAPVTDAGLDLADGGVDKNCLTIRQGPILKHLDLWPTETVGHLAPTARRAHEQCVEHDVWRLYYDAATPIMGDFVRLNPSYSVRPVSFGGKVGGKNRLYEPRRSNDATFSRRNIQMGYALRLRAQRTVRLLAGEDVDPVECLFIDPKIPQLERLLAELSRPIRRVNPTTGKLEIDKRGGDENAKSPDRFDSACLSFARDSDAGIRAR